MGIREIYNPSMDIPAIISKNLTQWMAESADLNTDKKVEARSGVGSSTVQRARTGNANVTVKSLEGIAAAFHRSAGELLSHHESARTVREPASIYAVNRDQPVVEEITALARSLDDIGKGMLLHAARSIARERKPSQQREAR